VPRAALAQLAEKEADFLLQELLPERVGLRQRWFYVALDVDRAGLV
jgi:hypothetical protein